MITYTVIRFFASGNRETLEESVSLEEAQLHCKDPDHSSRTCTSTESLDCTELYGSWFDGYEEE